MANKTGIHCKTKTIFLYWHSGERELPIIHRMNIDNFRHRLEGAGWEIKIVSLNPSDANYAGSLVDLPEFLFEIESKRQESVGTEALIGDVVRLMLLQKYGGAYFDVSTILLKNNIEDICLYQKLMDSPKATLAGYSNQTFTRKDEHGANYFLGAKDGIELGVLFAKNNSQFLAAFIAEIEGYWVWKCKEKCYDQYPPFLENKLTKVSFLNEYHVHYSILHLTLAKDPTLVEHIISESIHMTGKGNSITDGPYGPIDRFARTAGGYGSGQPAKLLNAFLPGSVVDYAGLTTSLEDRLKLFLKTELILIPGYMRVEIARHFKTLDDYYNSESAYKYFYRLI
jgi:hypothetical protein